MKISLKRIVPFTFAVRTIIILNMLVIAFHLLVMLKIIPYEMVWAGKLKSDEEMYLFESISMIINCFLIFIVLVKGGLIKLNIPETFLNIILWIFVIIFSLNTIGNLTSTTQMELLVATPLTFILAVLCWRLAIHKKQEP